MEYIYAAMLLHKAEKQMTEEHLKKVLEAAGITPDAARVKSLIASLEGVNIDEAMKKSVAMPVAASAEKKEEKSEEKKDDKKSEESAAAGLGSLFG